MLCIRSTLVSESTTWNVDVDLRGVRWWRRLRLPRIVRVEASNGFGIVLLFVADSMYLACPDKVENCSRCCPIHQQVKKPLKNKFSFCAKSHSWEQRSGSLVYFEACLYNVCLRGNEKETPPCIMYRMASFQKFPSLSNPTVPFDTKNYFWIPSYSHSFLTSYLLSFP